MAFIEQMTSLVSCVSLKIIFACIFYVHATYFSFVSMATLTNPTRVQTILLSFKLFTSSLSIASLFISFFR